MSTCNGFEDRTGWNGWLENISGELSGRESSPLSRVADTIIEKAHLNRGDRVLDLGAGIGLLTTRAARAVGGVGSVAALDSSLECVEKMQSDSVIMGGGNVLPVLGRLESLPFDPGAFDAVVCRSALIYAEDLNNAVLELARVLAAGGRFSVFEPLAAESEWRGDMGEAGPLFLQMEEALHGSGGLRSVDRRAVRTAFESAGLEFDSLVVRFEISMEGRDAEEVAREYLNDLPGGLSASNILKGSFEEPDIARVAEAFGRAAADGRIRGGLPCIYIWGTRAG